MKNIFDNEFLEQIDKKILYHGLFNDMGIILWVLLAIFTPIFMDGSQQNVINTSLIFMAILSFLLANPLKWRKMDSWNSRSFNTAMVYLIFIFLILYLDFEYINIE